MENIYKILSSMVILTTLLSVSFCKKTDNKPLKKMNSKCDVIKSSAGDIQICPVGHASFVLVTSKKTIYFDPVGGKELYKQYSRPDYILVTHTHFDHLDIKTIKDVISKDTKIVGTVAVKKKYGGAMAMKNGDVKELDGIKVEAIGMYNITKGRTKFHPRGQGNGYVVTINDKRVYVSGDTEDIPEMRNLKNIDAAFICMNLPYTMDEKQAASAVLEFKPKIVYPYHFILGKPGDVNNFKKLVNKNKNIEVRILNWKK
ncbi:MBL fold metallo-hydrolase [Spirochaetota bacterium]